MLPLSNIYGSSSFSVYSLMKSSLDLYLANRSCDAQAQRQNKVRPVVWNQEDDHYGSHQLYLDYRAIWFMANLTNFIYLKLALSIKWLILDKISHHTVNQTALCQRTSHTDTHPHDEHAYAASSRDRMWARITCVQHASTGQGTHFHGTSLLSSPHVGPAHGSVSPCECGVH
jgi:hypothetical protein